MYLETLKNIPNEGKILVEKVVSSGNDVRKENEEFLIKSKKHLASLYEKMKDFIEKESNNLLIQAQNLDKNLYKGNPNDIVLSFIDEMKKYKENLFQQKKQAESFAENPPGKEILNELILKFNKNLEELQEYGKNHKITIPWQLAYIAMADPEQQNSVVNFEGGRITDAKGRNIWGAQCYTCDLEIQDGAKGQGEKRIHCLDCDKSDQCMNCFQIVQALKKFLYKHGLNHHILEPIDSHLNHLKVEEIDINVFLKFPVKSQKNLASALYTCLKNFGSRPCYYQNKKWYSYDDLLFSSLKIGNILYTKLKEKSFVGICSENRLEWIASDFACTFNRFTSVGLHCSWPTQDIEYIIKETEMSCVICSKGHLDTFVKLKEKYSFLEYIIVLDDCKYHEKNVLDLNEIKSSEEGLSSYIEKVIVDSNDNDLIFSLIYSSGTTGTPKGIISTTKDWRDGNVDRSNFIEPLVILSYTPLAHGMDRGMCWQTISNGGRIILSSEDTLFKDAQKFEPTIFIAMPYIWNHLYSDYLLDVEKNKNVDYSKKLGNRVQLVATGGSFISPVILEFLRKNFSNSLVTNNYGLTEAPGVSSDGVLGEGVQLKLEDVYELGYTNKDEPFPRGEILVKTKTMTKGYFKKEKETFELFDHEGFLRTGDIGMLKDGKLEIIDRRKNLLEIYVDGRSEWVPVGSLEYYYGEHPKIKQIFIHGDRMFPYLISFLVLKDEAKIEDIYKDWKVIQKEKGLNYIPTHIIIEKEDWTIENECLTITGKIKRRKLFEKYKLQIDLAFEKSSILE